MNESRIQLKQLVLCTYRGSARIVSLWPVSNVIDIDMRDATEKSSIKTLGLQFGKRRRL